MVYFKYYLGIRLCDCEEQLGSSDSRHLVSTLSWNLGPVITKREYKPLSGNIHCNISVCAILFTCCLANSVIRVSTLAHILRRNLNIGSNSGL